MTDTEALARLEALTHGCTVLRGDVAAIRHALALIDKYRGALERVAAPCAYFSYHQRRIAAVALAPDPAPKEKP